MREPEYRPCVSAEAPPEMGGRKAGSENNRSRRQKVCLCGFFFCPKTEYRFCGPVRPGLDKGSRWKSGADALL